MSTSLPLTPIRFLHSAMDLFAGKRGIFSGDQAFTYGEFGERVERLSGALLQLGIQPGEPVAYLSFNTHQLLEGYYGPPAIGAMAMPLNVRLAAPELQTILRHAGVRILFYEPDFAALIPGFHEACPALEHTIKLADAYERLLSDAQPFACDVTSIDEQSGAELFYTSGSTGTPKGVVLSHRALHLHALNFLSQAEPEADAVDLHTIPLFHANGWGRPQTAVLMGSTQVMVRRFEPAGVFQLIEKHRATDMSLVPTMANALLMAPNREQWDISSLRRVIIGGAASSPELVERVEQALDCECIAGYGLTETSPALTFSRRKRTVAYTDSADRCRRQAMAGWVIPGVDLRVADADNRALPRDGQSIGEVIVRGDHVMNGYYREEAATAEVMRGGWFHTGDMAVWDEEGYVQIVDRKKEIIISGGENISSIEVEKAIYAHPKVYECAVVAAPDDQWGEIPVAIVALKDGQVCSCDELLDFLKTRLGRFKLPRQVEFRSEPLPKTGTGKIRKNVLREAFWQGKERRVQG